MQPTSAAHLLTGTRPGPNHTLPASRTLQAPREGLCPSAAPINAPAGCGEPETPCSVGLRSSTTCSSYCPAA